MSSRPLDLLYSRLACPHTRGNLSIEPVEVTSGDIRKGYIWSTRLNRVVGTIDNYRPRFVGIADEASKRDIAHCNGIPPVQIEMECAWQVEEVDSHLLRFVGTWTRPTAYWKVSDPALGDGHLTFSAPGLVEIHVVAHPYSGFATVSVDGVETQCVDLFHPHTAVPRIVRVELQAKSTVEVRPTGTKNQHSRGAQLIVESVHFQTGRLKPAGYSRTVRSRSNPFRKAARRMIQELPDDAIILDVGGGRRMVDDNRYLNLDYVAYDEVDLTGDAQNLPFKDESVEFVHSSAVFEHLPLPGKAADEIFRILKPGGCAYVNCAFMQPVHSEGQHFYNATVWGLDNWFKRFAHREIDYEGNFSRTVEWMGKVAGIRRRAKKKDWEQFLELAADFDKFITKERLLYIASGVSIVVRK